MAQISTKNLEVTAMQNAMANGSAISSSEMIAFTICFIFTTVVVLMTIVINYNTQAIRENKISPDVIARIFKRIFQSLLFFIITNLLIGVFYAF